MAYKFFQTGLSLDEDILSSSLCFVYAHVVGIVLILGFWWLFACACSLLKARKGLVVGYILCLSICVVIVLAIFPDTITGTPDAAYNYVYALEWLPMYWHGFLTNVFNCAILFAFPNPVFLSIVQCAIGLLVLFNLCGRAVSVWEGAAKKLAVVLISVFLVIQPETWQVLLFVGRNYAYAIPFTWLLGTMLLDKRDGVALSRGKLAALTFAVAILAVWRTEGLVLVLVFPLLIRCAYGVNPKRVPVKALVSYVVVATSLFLVLYLPGWYGSAKYQGSDYAIMNTPGPLSAVLLSSDADLSYEGVEDDLEAINALVPLEYIRDYGQLGSARYCTDTGRMNRQCGGYEGDEYLSASYSVLLHNYPIWVKYQCKLFLNSIGVQYPVQVNGRGVEYHVRGEDNAAFNQWLIDYWTIGKQWVQDSLPTGVRSASVLLSSIVGPVHRYLVAFGEVFAPVMKAIAVALVMLALLVSARRRQCLEVLVGVYLLCVLAVIIMTAPAIRANYYFYTFCAMYAYLLIMGTRIAGLRQASFRKVQRRPVISSSDDV